mgnify:CR=1 FL=1
MIYHSFPRVNQKLKLARQESLTGPLPAVDSLLQVLPDSSRLGGLSVDMYLDRPVFHLKGRQLPAGLYADSLQLNLILTRFAGLPDNWVDRLLIG